MELKGREIISLPIIDRSTGEDIGEVKDFIYDLEEKQLKAVIIADKGWPWGKNLVFFEDIETIGKDAVILNSGECIACTSDNEQAKRLCDSACKLAGHKVISNLGEDCGVIEDLIVDSCSGKIIGFEISNGLLTDLLEGRITIKCPEKFQLGTDVLVMEESVIETVINK